MSVETHWREDGDLQLAFDKLKMALIIAPVLGYADYSQPFVLETDASNDGLGAVLAQVQDGRTNCDSICESWLERRQEEHVKLQQQETGAARSQVGRHRKASRLSSWRSFNRLHR